MSTDNEYKDITRKIDNVINHIDKIKNGCIQMEKDSKKLNDTFNKSIEAERLIVNKLADYVNNPSLKLKLMKWLDSVTEKQKAMNQSIKIINDVLVNPGKRFSELFPNIIALNKKRDQLLMEISSLESKILKFETKERTGPNILKAHEAKQDYQKGTSNLLLTNNAIIEDGDMIINSSHPFFSISLKILMQSNLALFESLNNESLQISELFNNDVDLLKLGSTPEEHLNNRLNNIKSELSIVRNDHAVGED